MKPRISTPTYSMELHALRLGDCAFVTNPFELFLDYGQMIIARSRAKRTFLVQFACDTGRISAHRAGHGGGRLQRAHHQRLGRAGGRADARGRQREGD